MSSYDTVAVLTGPEGDKLRVRFYCEAQDSLSAEFAVVLQLSGGGGRWGQSVTLSLEQTDKLIAALQLARDKFIARSRSET